MEQIKKYDVFISSKSEDYPFAKEVYNFLTTHGLSVFIASEELRKIGDTQYADVIDKALDNSFHMIVVASSLSYLESKWVKYEWSTFSNDLKSGYREGNLMTILNSNIELRMLPASLRHQQSFHFVSYKNEILGYLQPYKKTEIKWTEHKPFNDESPEPKLVYGDTFVVELGNIRFEMLRIEGGKLEIGATLEQLSIAEDNEFPAHYITLPSFYMSKFPITQNIWETVMGYNKSHFKYKEYNVIAKPDLQKTMTGTLLKTFGPAGFVVGSMADVFSNNKKLKAVEDKGHYPAENLTYDEAREFVRRLSMITNIKFDLPTEYEWEYAARGGQKSKHFRYAGSNNLDDIAWYRNNSERSTHPVGQKLPNELGLYDMCGNVWEWTKTPAHPYATDIEPRGNIFIRRGGSWWHEDKNCRVSRRYASDGSKKTSGLGLRVVIREYIEEHSIR